MSERKLASIEKIINIEPILNADEIELVSVLGWHVIVRKEENYKIGDLIIYCEYDTILPINPEFEFLRSCCYSAKYDGFRIKNRKLRGVFSEGIVFPTSILPSFSNPSKKPKYFKEGESVVDILGIQKYDPEALKEVEKAKKSKNPIIKHFMRYKWFRKWVGNRKPKYGYPSNIHKANETNIQVCFNRLQNQDFLYYKSEKLEGQNAVYHITKKGKFKVYSHNMGRPKQNNNWWNIALKFDIENQMKRFMKLHGIKSMYISGEIIGPGIQRNIYSLNSLDFYIYTISSLDDNIKFRLNDIKLFCDVTRLKHVPILAENVKLLESSDAMLEDCEGKSIFGSTIKGLREGIIWRTIDGTDGCKVKSKKYQTIWNKKDITE